MQVRCLNIPCDALDRHRRVDGRAATACMEDIDGFLGQSDRHPRVHAHTCALFQRPRLSAGRFGIHQIRRAIGVKLRLIDFHCRFGYLEVRETKMEKATQPGYNQSAREISPYFMAELLLA